MPILDEERYLAEAVSSVLAQDYPGELEVVVALGPSTDGTTRVAGELAAAEPRIVLVDNPSGSTPAGLNAALRVARHQLVARVDGHIRLPEHYLSTAVRVLATTDAANVGGQAVPQGVEPMQRAIGVAMRSRLGMGGARFRVGGSTGPADTVFPGVYRREWLERLGGFDERHQRGQDWELNLRIRRAKGTVWFTHDLDVGYSPRGSLRALGRQFFRTGQSRRGLVRQYPDTASPRYLAPPLATVAIAVGTVGGLLWWPLWLVPGGYVAAVTAGGLLLGAPDGVAVAVRVPPALATMHLSWGLGYLLGPRG